MRVIGRREHPRRRRGLTLIESMVALTILPLAVVAIAYAVVAGQAQAVEAMNRSRAALLAEALMEEIVALPYDSGVDGSLGPESGETTRDRYNSPNDFHGYSEAAGALADPAGNKYPAPFQRFSRSVSCRATSVTVTGFAAATDCLDVTVTVSDNGEPVITLNRLIADAP